MAKKRRIPNSERFDRLQALPPPEAVRVWLEGDFGIGDEPAMIAAIRADPRVTLADRDIIDVICGAMDDGVDARTCLARLMAFG